MTKEPCHESYNRMSNPKAACVLIEKTDCSVLCVSRRDNLNNWCLPGGKAEPGEYPGMTAVRELFEETGVKIPSNTPFARVYDAECAGDITYDCTTYYIKAEDIPGLDTFELVASAEGIPAWRDWGDLLDGNSSFCEYNWGLINEMNKRDMAIVLAGEEG